MPSPDAPRAPRRGPLLTPLQLGIVVIAVLLTIASVVALVRVLPPAIRASAPDRPVRAYLQAIADGDITRALKLGGITPGAGDKLLTDAAYGQSSDRVSSFIVLGTRLDGRSGVVEARIRQGDASYDADFRIVRGGGIGPLSTWSLAPQKLPTITFTIDAPVELSLHIGGATLPSHDKRVSERVFPGTYDVDAGDTAYYLGGVSAASATFAGQLGAASPIRLALTHEGEEKVQSEVSAWVTACAASTSMQPDGCPFRALPQPATIYSDGRWAVQSQPSLTEGSWSDELGGWPVTTSTPGYVSYSADATQGGLAGTATTGSRPFSVVGTAVPDAKSGIRFVPVPSYAAAIGGALA